MTCHEHTVMAPATVLETAPGRALLNVTRQSACKSCAEKAQCGNPQETLRGQKMWFATEMQLTAGETVTVTMPETAVWHAASLAYGLPLAGFIGGLMSGALLGEIPALLGALAGLAFGFIGAGILASKSHAPLKILVSTTAPQPTLHPVKEES